MRLLIATVLGGLLLAGGASAQPLPPAAIYTDPPADKAYPARPEILHVPTGGVEVNGIAYLAAGAGPHPTAVVFHGLPGNEKNLDIAQTLRRAGWNAVQINYRGSWGSPGHFSFKGNLEDAKALLAYLRAPANAARLRIDTRRLVIIGHSMGGWVSAETGAVDPGLAAVVLISAADMGRPGTLEAREKRMAANRESLSASAHEMAEELASLTPGFGRAAPGLARTPLLVLSADDGLAPDTDALVAAVRAAGGTRVRSVHVATDHSWSDARIRLQTEILSFLGDLPK